MTGCGNMFNLGGASMILILLAIVVDGIFLGKTANKVALNKRGKQKIVLSLHLIAKITSPTLHFYAGFQY